MASQEPIKGPTKHTAVVGRAHVVSPKSRRTTGSSDHWPKSNDRLMVADGVSVDAEQFDETGHVGFHSIGDVRRSISRSGID